MSYQVRTIAEIVNDKKIPIIKGTVYNTQQLVSRTLKGKEVADLKVDGVYQRMVDPGRIKKYGLLNPQWLTAAIIAQRPDGSLYIIDGQNKACLYFRSKEQSTEFHCLVFVHDKETSVGNCRKIEAEIYKNINENLKSLSTLQKIRSGVVFGDPESCWVEMVMNQMNLTSQGFGSQKKDALEVLGFNQFYIMVTKYFPRGTNELISMKRIDRMLSGLEIYKKMWAFDPILTQNSTGKNKPSVYGNVLRGCVLTHEYSEDVLGIAQSVKLDEFLQPENRGNNTTKQVSKMIGADGFSAKNYLHKAVLDQYTTYANIHGYKGPALIGKETHKKALEQFGQKFTNPQ